jgi:tRNA (cmo5U34)-methyltransferase
MSEQHDPFEDPNAVASYAEGPARNVPGWADMLQMARLLVAERVPHDGRVLVIGAGGGLELKRFAEAHPDWSFVGVDPAREMLKLARSTLGPLASRVECHEGYVDTAPAGPFDAATCLLTLHFVPLAQRLQMLAEIRKRLRPSAPFVIAHLSFPQKIAERQIWLRRYAAFIASSGVDHARAQAGAEAVGSRLPVLSPDQDERMLREAGFSGVQLFYAGFAFRGWVSYA